jgi:aldose sugar dehydrogenase
MGRSMDPGLALPAFVLAVALQGGGRPAPPSSTPTGGTAAISIKGTERIRWDQASDTTEIATLQFAALVDGRLVPLADAACQPTADPAAFSCSSALPAMAPGPHRIRLVAIAWGARSEPSMPTLPAVVSAAAAAAAATSPSAAGSRTGFSAGEATADGVGLQVDTLAEGLADPTDLALASDGTIVVAERAGRIRIYADGRLRDQPAAVLDATLTAGGELLAVALDPAFDSNRRVYVVHTAAAPPGSDRSLDFRVTRLTESGGTLGKAVVLLDAVPAAAPRAAAALRFGPDGKLYAAFDDGGSRHAAGDMSSFSGKVLRLNPDATTPPDQPAASPVFVSGLARPRSLNWSADGRVLWVSETSDADGELLSPFAISTGPPRRTESRAAYRLPSPFSAGGAATCLSTAVAEFQGNLFVGSQTPGGLLRIRFERDRPLDAASTERLLEGVVGSVRAVAIGADGRIYVSTDRALLRITPVGRTISAL